MEELWSRHEIGGLLLERDGHFPADDELRDELARLDAAAARGRARRHAGTTSTHEANQPTTSDATHISSARQRLHVDQRKFIQAVTAAGPVPLGIDADDLRAVTAVLTHKRASTVAHAAPDIAALPRFADSFRPWAATHPAHGCAACDAAQFVRSLPPTDRTGRAGAIALRAELDHPVHTRRGRPRPARVRLRAIRSPGAITLGIRLGRRLVRHLTLRRPDHSDSAGCHEHASHRLDDDRAGGAYRRLFMPLQPSNGHLSRRAQAPTRVPARDLQVASASSPNARRSRVTATPVSSGRCARASSMSPLARSSA